MSGPGVFARYPDGCIRINYSKKTGFTARLINLFNLVLIAMFAKGKRMIVTLIHFFFLLILLFASTEAGKNMPKFDLSIQPKNLYNHVDTLVSLSPARSVMNPISLREASGYIKSTFEDYNISTEFQYFQYKQQQFRNVVAVINQGKGPIIVVGAHYDVHGEQPGADDNASGVAGLLEVGRLLKEREKSLQYEFQLVAYTNEEAPFFGTEFMGSYIHAKSLYDSNANVKFMISLEMIGYFTDEPNSQDYPSALLKPFYPSVGNFIAVVSNFYYQRNYTCRRAGRCTNV